ncbi:hypothetical protein GY45DRAFT_1355149 [Cubamyces sp. BRFM 1775]|nr:hypothetical protein GY45DRAFT_1355149 [Cubamyces sp. BRFM 1775]
MKNLEIVSEASDNPPWYGRHEDGSIHYSGVPNRLLSHPELVRRGIVLHDALKPGVVFRTLAEHSGADYDYVVKVLDLEDEELEIYERLLDHISSPRNHTIPSELIRNGHPILIMPLIYDIHSMLFGRRCESFSKLAEILYQLVEGVYFLHTHHIVHMDLCFGNVGGTPPSPVPYRATLPPGRVYIYDFNTSRQFTRGPGSQPAITLPETQIRPPNGLTHFDPYSWDVYCLGVLLNGLMDMYAEDKPSPPWLLRRYAQWLIGNERGCRTVCRCRPTARTALCIMSIVRFMLSTLDSCATLYQRVLSIFRRTP